MSGFGGILILAREAGAWFGGLAVPSKLTVVTIALATTGVGVAVVAPDALPISPFRASHNASAFSASASTAKPAAPVNPSIVASAKPTTGAATTPSAAAPTSVPRSTAPTMPGADESKESSSAKATKSTTTTKKATATSSVSPSASASVYYKDCEAAWAAGAAPIPKNKPGYRIELDSDQNGVACEKKKP